jgi:hypothetical protein
MPGRVPCWSVVTVITAKGVVTDATLRLETDAEQDEGLNRGGWSL